MAVRKGESKGKWLAEAYIAGKRVRKWFDSKADANRFYNAVKQENSPLARFVKVRAEQRLRMADAAKLWFDLHGHSLVRGESNLAVLTRIAHALNNPFLSNLTAEMFADYRQKRLNGEIAFDEKRQKVSASTIRYEFSLVIAMFNELKRLGKVKGENPLQYIRNFKVKEKELYFLRDDEILRLLEACKAYTSKPDLYLIVKLCLATGARWSEIQNLTRSQVIPHKITFIKTKSGKNRTVPITPELYNEIPHKSGKLFEHCQAQFSLAIKKAGIDLPKGQATHILRHTFASHFMMNGGNILVLQNILGHSSITMTMRYAHFAPSYLESATTLNPLATIAQSGD